MAFLKKMQKCKNCTPLCKYEFSSRAKKNYKCSPHMQFAYMKLRQHKKKFTNIIYDYIILHDIKYNYVMQHKK